LIPLRAERIMPTMDVDLELFQFRFSHYNEKVRWALDFKGLQHQRTDLLPGPHAAMIKRLTGQHQTPVLRMNNQYVHDSAWIIERLELLFKDAPSLLPSDSAQRDRARELARHFDLVLGPAARICVFVAMLDDADYIARLFSTGKPWLTRTTYRAVMPLMKGRIRKSNGITGKAAISEAQRLVAANMESIAKLTFKNRYLAGNAFSVADLTAAALIAPMIDPPHPDMKKPEPMPAQLAELTDKWQRHPAGRWALEMYERHRTIVNRS
jgi:glutathione S-transferase